MAALDQPTAVLDRMVSAPTWWGISALGWIPVLTPKVVQEVHGPRMSWVLLLGVCAGVVWLKWRLALVAVRPWRSCADFSRFLAAAVVLVDGWAAFLCESRIPGD